jgi:hypothetical protein
MAKHVYQGSAVDGTGRIIASATCTVCLNESATAATIYDVKATADSGARGTAKATNTVSSGTDGKFIFYVDDGDYAPGQMFKITLSKSGYTSQSWDDIELI